VKKHKGDTGESQELAEDAFEVLASYDWPGNVRELENAIQYAVAVSHGDLITIADLPLHVVERARVSDDQTQAKPVSLLDDRPTIDQLNKRYVQLILAENSGNKTLAAQILGINRRTLYRYLDDEALEQDPPSSPPDPQG